MHTHQFLCKNTLPEFHIAVYKHYSEEVCSSIFKLRTEEQQSILCSRFELQQDVKVFVSGLQHGQGKETVAEEFWVPDIQI